MDLLRGLAAAAVLIHHYRFLYTTRTGVFPADWNIARQPFSNLLAPIYKYGGDAVPLFWMLSGFVFAATYGHQSRPISAKQFVVARFARLYPLHFVTLLAVTGLQIASMNSFGHFQIYRYNDLYHFGLQLFMASNWGFEQGYSFNGPIWSVSVEIVIYAAFLAYLLVVRLNWLSALVMLAAFTVLRVIGPATIAGCGMCFFIGVLLYLFGLQVAKWPRAPSLALATLAFTGFLLIMAVRPHVPQSILTLTVFAALALLFWAVIVCDLFLPEVPKHLHWIGDITYSTYLLHAPIIMSSLFALRALHAPAFLADNPIMLLTFLTTTIAAAFLTYRSFELPMQKYLRKMMLKNR